MLQSTFFHDLDVKTPAAIGNHMHSFHWLFSCTNTESPPMKRETLPMKKGTLPVKSIDSC